MACRRPQGLGRNLCYKVPAPKRLIWSRRSRKSAPSGQSYLSSICLKRWKAWWLALLERSSPDNLHLLALSCTTSDAAASIFITSLATTQVGSASVVSSNYPWHRCDDRLFRGLWLHKFPVIQVDCLPGTLLLTQLCNHWMEAMNYLHMKIMLICKFSEFFPLLSQALYPTLSS